MGEVKLTTNEYCRVSGLGYEGHNFPVTGVFKKEELITATGSFPGKGRKGYRSEIGDLSRLIQRGNDEGSNLLGSVPRTV